MNELISLPAHAEEVEPLDNNSAWAEINTPLTPEELLEFCRDTQRLFRINPYLEIKRWETIDDGCFEVEGINYSQEKPFSFHLWMRVTETDGGLSIKYLEGMKSATLIKVESSEFGSKLIITDIYYPVAESCDETDLSQIDRSLTGWMRDIQQFLTMWKKWRRVSPWRWYMSRVWQPMKPSSRRIAYMLWWITLVEIALIFLGALIYWAEYS